MIDWKKNYTGYWRTPTEYCVRIDPEKDEIGSRIAGIEEKLRVVNRAMFGLKNEMNELEGQQADLWDELSGLLNMIQKNASRNESVDPGALVNILRTGEGPGLDPDAKAAAEFFNRLIPDGEGRN